MNAVYHHLLLHGQVSSAAPSLQLSSASDQSPALLYLSLSDEVELMATFTLVDVISVLRLGSRGRERPSYLLSAAAEPTAHTCPNGFSQIIKFFLIPREALRLAPFKHLFLWKQSHFLLIY